MSTIDFRCLANPSNTWTFTSKAFKSTRGHHTDYVPIPASPPPNKVIDGIYISNILTASFYLKSIAPAIYDSSSSTPAPSITHVLSIISGRAWHENLVTKAPSSEIVHKKIIISDRADANLMEWFPEICAFIHTALNPQLSSSSSSLPPSASLSSNPSILIHCHAGISRSATAISSYLIYAHQHTLRSSLTLLRTARPEVNPNQGFRAQLRLWRELECELLEDWDGDEPKGEFWSFMWGFRSGKGGVDERGGRPDLKVLRAWKRPNGKLEGKLEGKADEDAAGGVGDQKGDKKRVKEKWETWTDEMAAISPVGSPSRW